MQRPNPAQYYTCMVYLGFLSRKFLLLCCYLFILFLPVSVFAEGSKELTQNGGFRAYLYSSTEVSVSFPFPTRGLMKVYAKVGETIHVASSAQGLGGGTINLRSPDGSTYTSGNSTTVGRINNRTEEIAGPSPNAGGYTAFTRVVAAGQEGVWEIDFIGQSNSAGSENNPTPQSSTTAWTQGPGAFIAAFDVSVRNTGNTAFLTGRVFTNIFSGIIGGFIGGFNGVFHILTKDGYQYVMDNNGQSGNGFSFFSNNKGFRAADGKASYKSFNSVSGDNVHNPTAADTQSDITHKIFFNAPAADLPLTAPAPGNGSTWLMNPPFVPSATDINFKGGEGTDAKTGPTLGGSINFTTTSNGTYTIVIDVNSNGVFTDPADRTLTGQVTLGANSVKWDGLDELGTVVAAGAGAYTANINLSLISAEVHFPFYDVERNINGIKLTRITGANAPDNTVYWDDSDISVTGTPSSPITNLTGQNSLVNGHKWGSPFFADPNSDFGNERSIDTWAYVANAIINTAVTFTIQEADLEVTSLTSDITNGCLNQVITYTTAVKNNGPTDVAGATFSFAFPTELTKVTVTSTETTGTTVISNEQTTATGYTAKLDIPNGGVRTFTITGTVSKLPAATLDVVAAILRPADIADPDATNPNSATPTDPFDECDAQPSGVGCNNIKTASATFFALPKAGDDQVTEKNKTITLTGNGAGSWTQLGTTPAVATIVSPSTASTTVSGLTAEGDYKFIFTNASGCADTLNVSVTSPNLDDSPNVVTPNGDGINDEFIIPGINNYPGSKLSIYNRWGNEVYHSDQYANNWAGAGLSDGTYYYMFTRKDKAGTIKVFKGWIYLKH
ncbi:MAG: gliding motility-associated C-terminal domain-containing protein [Bacteroidota bacterium]